MRAQSEVGYSCCKCNFKFETLELLTLHIIKECSTRNSSSTAKETTVSKPKRSNHINKCSIREKNLKTTQDSGLLLTSHSIIQDQETKSKLKIEKVQATCCKHLATTSEAGVASVTEQQTKALVQPQRERDLVRVNYANSSGVVKTSALLKNVKTPKVLTPKVKSLKTSLLPSTTLNKLEGVSNSPACNAGTNSSNIRKSVLFCPYCRKSFCHLFDLKRHKSKACLNKFKKCFTLTQKNICKYCSLKFTNGNALRTHTLVYCKLFKLKKALLKRKRSFKQKKSFKSNQFGKSLVKKRDLEPSVELSKEVPVSTQELFQEGIVEEKERFEECIVESPKVICQYCRTEYLQEADLTNHKLQGCAHEKRTCKYCGLKCLYESDLAVHVKNAHLRSKNPVCPDTKVSPRSERKVETSQSASNTEEEITLGNANHHIEGYAGSKSRKSNYEDGKHDTDKRNATRKIGKDNKANPYQSSSSYKSTSASPNLNKQIKDDTESEPLKIDNEAEKQQKWSTNKEVSNPSTCRNKSTCASPVLNKHTKDDAESKSAKVNSEDNRQNIGNGNVAIEMDKPSNQEPTPSTSRNNSASASPVLRKHKKDDARSKSAKMNSEENKQRTVNGNMAIKMAKPSNQEPTPSTSSNNSASASPVLKKHTKDDAGSKSAKINSVENKQQTVNGNVAIKMAKPGTQEPNPFTSNKPATCATPNRNKHTKDDARSSRREREDDKQDKLNTNSKMPEREKKKGKDEKDEKPTTSSSSNSDDQANKIPTKVRKSSKFSCLFCDQSFKSKSDMSTHKMLFCKSTCKSDFLVEVSQEPKAQPEAVKAAAESSCSTVAADSKPAHKTGSTVAVDSQPKNETSNVKQKSEYEHDLKGHFCYICGSHFLFEFALKNHQSKYCKVFSVPPKIVETPTGQAKTGGEMVTKAAEQSKTEAEKIDTKLDETRAKPSAPTQPETMKSPTKQKSVITAPSKDPHEDQNICNNCGYRFEYYFALQKHKDLYCKVFQTSKHSVGINSNRIKNVEKCLEEVCAEEPEFDEGEEDLEDERDVSEGGVEKRLSSGFDLRETLTRKARYKKIVFPKGEKSDRDENVGPSSKNPDDSRIEEKKQHIVSRIEKHEPKLLKPSINNVAKAKPDPKELSPEVSDSKNDRSPRHRKSTAAVSSTSSSRIFKDREPHNKGEAERRSKSFRRDSHSPLRSRSSRYSKIEQRSRKPRSTSPSRRRQKHRSISPVHRRSRLDRTPDKRRRSSLPRTSPPRISIEETNRKEPSCPKSPIYKEEELSVSSINFEVHPQAVRVYNRVIGKTRAVYCEKCGASLRTVQEVVKPRCKHHKHVFPCPVCKLSFPDLNTLITHQDLAHYPDQVTMKELENAGEVMRYYCCACGAAFNFIKNLISHKVAHHKFFHAKSNPTELAPIVRSGNLGLIGYACTICNKKLFSSLQLLLEHELLSEKHKKRLEVFAHISSNYNPVEQHRLEHICYVCMLGFLTFKDLQIHMLESSEHFLNENESLGKPSHILQRQYSAPTVSVYENSFNSGAVQYQLRPAVLSSLTRVSSNDTAVCSPVSSSGPTSSCSTQDTTAPDYEVAYTVPSESTEAEAKCEDAADAASFLRYFQYSTKRAIEAKDEEANKRTHQCFLCLENFEEEELLTKHACSGPF